MPDQKFDGQLPICNRTFITSEHEQIDKNKQDNVNQQHVLSAPNPPREQTTVIFPCEGTSMFPVLPQQNSSNISLIKSDRPCSTTISTDTCNSEALFNNSSQVPISTSNEFSFFQSIKDLTYQELYRANPLGLLGKEIISATGTTHCPEPIPPKEDNETSAQTVDNTSKFLSNSSKELSSIHEPKLQQIRFPLNEEEKLQMQRHRSALVNLSEAVFPPCPAEYISNLNNDEFKPNFFSQPSPNTIVADFIPDTMTINVFEVFIYAWGVIAFFFDMITDLVLAHAYYSEGAYWLFLLTLMCVVVPNLTLSIFSLVWYIDGSQLKAAANKKNATTQFNNTSMYETTSSEDTFEKNQEPINNSSELVPLNSRPGLSYQMNDYHEDEQIDGYVSRLKQRPQIPEQDTQRQNSVKRKYFQLSAATVNVLTWIIRIIILVLQLDFCLKYIRGLYYTWMGFRKRHNPKWQRFYLTKQILIDADIALLRVFDCFMDSGSQVTLQLYIMLRLGSTSIKFDTLFLKQSLSIGSSLGSLAYALCGYSRCWRHMQLTHSPQDWPKGKPTPQLVSWWSTIIQWFWYLFLITPRVCALAMFAATFRSWFWIILTAHWFGMLFWILRFRTIFCISDQTKYNPREAIFEKCYNLVCSYIFIFCYMNLRKGNTRAHYIGFYTIYYIENIAFSIIYGIHSAESNLIFKYTLVIFVCCGFWLAVLFQFIYYRFLHPSDHVRLNAKRRISSIVRTGLLLSSNRVKKSKLRGEMINHNNGQNTNENKQLIEVIPPVENSNDERWYNRFAKRNRQKLISQQQAIDQKVKITRAQSKLEEATKYQYQQQPSSTSMNRISKKTRRPTELNISTGTEPNDNSFVVHKQSVTAHPSYVDSRSNYSQQLFNIPRVSLVRSQHPESYAKMRQVDEEDEEEEENENLHRPHITSVLNKRTPQHQRQSKFSNNNKSLNLSDENPNNTIPYTSSTTNEGSDKK